MSRQKSTKKSSGLPDRRRVLLASAAVVQAPLLTAQTAAAKAELEPPADRPKFEETEHIRKFYASNRY